MSRLIRRATLHGEMVRKFLISPRMQAMPTGSEPTESEASRSASTQSQSSNSKPQHPLSIKELRETSNRPYVQQANTLPPTLQAAVVLRDDPNNSSELRRQIRYDEDALWNTVLHITHGDQAISLYDSLSRQDISVMFAKLVDSQLKGLVKLDTWRGGDRSNLQFKAQKNESDFKYRKVSQIMRALCNAPGFELSDVEINLVLKMAIKNNDFRCASLWIRTVERSIIDTVDPEINIPNFKPSLEYLQYKLQVIGKTSPLRWGFPNNNYMNRRAYRSKSVISESWGSLVHKVSTSEYVLNLETHIELISGFAKNGSIDQAKKYIQDIWGIKEDGSKPTHVVGRDSAVYPNAKLLQRIINIFAYYGKLDEVMGYLSSFDRHYKLKLYRDTRIWKTLIQFLINSEGKKEDIVESFRSVWKIMQYRDVKICARLLWLKLEILNGSEYEIELVEELPKIREKYRYQRSMADNKKIEKLMSYYLKVAIAVVYKDDIEADDVVMNLLKDYTFNHEQFESLLETSKLVKKRVESEKAEFEELQKQYDDEDEEDALW